MKFAPTLSRLLLLCGLAFLGFYVYGIVIGVFSPGEMIGFTVVALGVAAACAIYFRRASVDPSERTAIMRDLHDQRERRGF